MTDNGGFGWRPIEPGDVPAWAVLLAAAADADGAPNHYGEQNLLGLFELPDCDFAAGSIAAFDGTVMVASAFLTARPAADPPHVRFDGTVHPAYRRRGLGGQVLDWVENAAVALHEKSHPGRPLSVRGGSTVGNAGQEALFAGRGYRPVRWWHMMRLDLSAAPSAAPAPDGVTISAFTPEASEDARQVRNEAFQDHWGSSVTTAESWLHHLKQESFRPELSYVAYADGQAIGIVLSHEHDAPTKATGIRDLYIGIVGTRRAGRNRGIASALLSRALTDGRAAGYGKSSLVVDADSLTGAVGLYERIGYTVESTGVSQSKQLTAAAGDQPAPGRPHREPVPVVAPATAPAVRQRQRRSPSAG